MITEKEETIIYEILKSEIENLQGRLPRLLSSKIDGLEDPERLLDSCLKAWSIVNGFFEKAFQDIYK